MVMSSAQRMAVAVGVLPHQNAFHDPTITNLDTQTQDATHLSPTAAACPHRAAAMFGPGIHGPYMSLCES